MSWQLPWVGQKLFQKWCSHSPSSPSCDYISWRCRLKQTALCNRSERSTSLRLSSAVTVIHLSRWSHQNTPKNCTLLKYSFMFVPHQDWRCSDFSLQVARVKRIKIFKISRCVKLLTVAGGLLLELQYYCLWLHAVTTIQHWVMRRTRYWVPTWRQSSEKCSLGASSKNVSSLWICFLCNTASDL